MGRTSETETASWLTPNLWTVISGLTMERRVWRRGFLEKKDDQEKDLVLLFARARTTVGPLEVSSFVDIEGMPASDRSGISRGSFSRKGKPGGTPSPLVRGVAESALRRVHDNPSRRGFWQLRK